jgi:hypothetical protein
MKTIICSFLSFTPGFSRVIRLLSEMENRLNGFLGSRHLGTWLKPGVNDTSRLESPMSRLHFKLESTKQEQSYIGAFRA